MLSPKNTTQSPSFSSGDLTTVGKSAAEAPAAKSARISKANRREASRVIEENSRQSGLTGADAVPIMAGHSFAHKSRNIAVLMTSPTASGGLRPPLAQASASVPDALGRFGEYGRRFVPETLMHALEELTAEYARAKADPQFQADLEALLKDYVGRPNPLYFAERLTKHCGGARIYLKREDLNHTGAHKINNSLAQALLTIRMGKSRVIAETGAGQHGVATATACARFGLPCVVFMGEEDIRRQRLNVFKMRLMGAEVRPVSSGSKTLKDATNEAFRDWMSTVENTHYIVGSVVGPHPFPMMVRDFQSIIGREARQQCLDILGRLPE